VQRSRPAEQVEPGEQQVHQEVRAEDHRVEHPEGGVEHLVVEVQRAQERLVLAHDVEAAVAVQEPRARLLKHPAAEPEVALFGGKGFDRCGGHDSSIS
jgi:hypothetical protein